MFKFNWILVNKLAVGSYPREKKDFEKLKDEGIVSIFSLCNLDEILLNQNEVNNFIFKNLALPDHKSGRFPTGDEINKSINTLNFLIEKGPVFVHCFAGIERSPLVCMAWLKINHKLSTYESLQYMMEMNPGTNPLPGQLKILDNLI